MLDERPALVPVDDVMDEDDWSLEYDMDDQREHEALESDVNQVEEEGESDLDHFTESSENISEDSEADLDPDMDVVMELDRTEGGRSKYEESEESEDGVIVVEDHNEDLEDNIQRGVGSSSEDTDHDQHHWGMSKSHCTWSCNALTE